MKKFISILLVGVMSLSLAACTKDEAKPSDSASTSPEVSTSADPSAEPSTEPAKSEDTDGDKKNASDVKVTLLVSGNLGDMSFNDSAHAGVNEAVEKLGITAKTIECNSDQSKFEPALLEAAEDGSTMVIGSSNFRDYIQQYADDYPEVTFIIFDEEIDWSKGEYNNVYSIMYKNNEGAFLGGFLAAELTKSGEEGYNDEKVIGFLGGMDQPVINDFLVGYIEGAQYSDPETKVVTAYTNSFSDSAKGKEYGFSLINQKADISFNVAGGAGTGLIEASVESKTNVLGVDSDQAMKFEATKPEYSAAIPTSILKNVGFTLFRAIEQYIDGSLKTGGAELLGIAEGAMGVAENKYYEEQVPEEIRTKLVELEEKVLSGEIEISTAYNMTTDEIIAIRNSASGQ